MCVVAFAWNAHPRWRLLLAGNRDEFHARPTAALAAWDDGSGIVAGRDLEAGGTWLGVDGRGRCALVTNVRDLRAPHILTVSFPAGRPAGFIAALEAEKAYARAADLVSKGIASRASLDSATAAPEMPASNGREAPSGKVSEIIIFSLLTPGHEPG